MELAKELEAALDGLENAAGEFDAIDQELNQLTKKLAFFSSSTSSPSTTSKEAIHSCEQQITTHEKTINRSLSHFNKVISRHEQPRSLNVAAATSEILESIDELVRVHLSETGYASVSDIMQNEAPGRCLGDDALMRCFAYESYINEMFYKITGGEVGYMEKAHEISTEVHNTDGCKEGNSHQITSTSVQPESLETVAAIPLADAERFLYFTCNSSSMSSNKDNQLTNPVQLKAKEVLEHHKPLMKVPDSYHSSTASKEWQCSQTIEYEFLKNLKHGTAEALEFLRSVANSNNPELARNTPTTITTLDTERLITFAGKLVTSNPENADQDTMTFLLNLRAELLRRARNDSSISLPRTDLNTLVHIGAKALRQHLIPLQTTKWEGNEELPVEIDMIPENYYHPIFVCPVTKEQASSDELSVLPCGHLLSVKAVGDLLDISSTSEKCPYCPKYFQESETKLVTLPRSMEEAYGSRLRRDSSGSTQ